MLKFEYEKAGIGAFVEPPFRIIKCQPGFVQAIYKGLKKNDNKLADIVCLSENRQTGSNDPGIGLIRPKTEKAVKSCRFRVVFDEQFIIIDG